LKTTKTAEESRLYVRNIQVITNQKLLNEMSLRLEPRRWTGSDCAMFVSGFRVAESAADCLDSAGPSTWFNDSYDVRVSRKCVRWRKIRIHKHCVTWDVTSPQWPHVGTSMPLDQTTLWLLCRFLLLAISKSCCRIWLEAIISITVRRSCRISKTVAVYK